MAPIMVTDRQILPFKVAAFDVDGNPATLASPPTATLVPPEAGTVAADPADATGMSFIFTPTDETGHLGDVQIQLSADPGGGAPAITGALSVTVVSSAAASLAATPGAPVSK